MSYDLWFWKYADEGRYPPGRQPVFRDHCEALSAGSPPADIAALPVADVSEALGAAMRSTKDWVHDEGPFWKKTPSGIAEVYVHPRHVTLSLRGGWTGDDANRLIDVMTGFGCPLYDPQTGERFEA